MEKREIDKMLKPKMTIVYILIFIYIGIAALCIGFAFSKAYKQYEQRIDSLNFAELVSNGREEEGLYASLNIAYLPKILAANSKKDSYLYYAIDEEDNVYIVRLSNKTFDYLKSIADEETRKLSSIYHLNGFTHKIDPQTESLVLRNYDKVFPNIKLTSENLYEHLGKIYLDENISPKSRRTVDLYKAIAMVGVFFLVAAFGFIVPAVIRSKKVLKNPELVEVLRSELGNLTDNKYQKYRLYLTENYIISGIDPLKYEDIVWAYTITLKNYTIKTGKSLLAYTKDKKKHVVISVGPKDNVLDDILIDLQEKNPNIKIGYNKENKKFFENYQK